MILIAANNAQTTLAGGISNVAITANLQSGSGSLFPNPTVTEQYFVGSFVDAATGLLTEIVWVTQRVGDTITMTRGQEGTSQRAWSPNDLFGNLMTAGQLETMVQIGQLQGQQGNYAVDTGSTNAVLCSLTPTLSTPVNGMPIRVLIANTNTGSTTFNPGTGAADVVNPDGTDLSANQLIAGGIFTFYWNSNYGKWQLGDLVSPSDIPTGSVMPSVNLNQPNGWYFMYGQALSRTTDSNLFNNITRSSTVTIPVASPGVVTWISHGLVNGSLVSFENSGGSLPGGLSIGVNYFVISATTNTFEVSATEGGGAINFTGSESGTQTCRFNPWGCGNGTTTFNLPDGRGRSFFGADNIGGSFAGILGSGRPGGITGPAIIGTTGGEQAHVQDITELVSHDHTYLGFNNTNNAASGGGAPAVNNPGTTSFTGGGLAMNVTPPSFVGNWLVKR